MIQVTPTEVKMAATGIKSATKEEMIEAMAKEHPEVTWLTRKFKGEMELLGSNEHIADAMAAIKAGILTDDFRITISMLKSAQKAVS